MNDLRAKFSQLLPHLHCTERSAAQVGLVALLFVNLIIGLLTLTDYGESWDEYNFFNYAEESLAAYPGLFQPGFERTFSDPTLRHYGAWFLMTCVLAARLFPDLIISDVAHFLTFLVFQGGIVLLYLLARRWLDPWPAFGAALLYATQPVLWGHAFINARDIPFHVTFMAALYFGLRFSDSLLPLPETQKIKLDTSEWARLGWPLRIGLVLLLLLGMLAFAWLAFNLYAGWMSEAALRADTSDARELDLYLRPILGQFWAGLIFLGLTLAWSALLFLSRLLGLRAALWQSELQPFAHQLGQVFRSSAFWLAAIALALTVGIRVMGGMAAVLVVVHAFWRVRRAAFLPVFFYGVFAILLVIPTWPYLWGEPLLRLLITLRLMTAFPWPGQVLFAGVSYAGNELPRAYLPTLFAIQLTESLLLLLGLGLLFFLRKNAPGEMLLLCLVWFGLPIGMALVGRPYLYDNFRQMLFALPPLFLLAGWGLQNIWRSLPRAWLRAVLLFVLLLPGLLGIARIHPYQYIYYNSLVGGVSGAFRQYEMDYWGTSFREAARFLNANAPQNAEVVVVGPPTTLWRYVRPDIHVYNVVEERNSSDSYYLLISTRNNRDLDMYPSAPTVYQVEKDGAILAVLRFIE
ncbi:MAG: glycosyltransferase family 39 protein [Anaerolineae bacterium]|nr:glycosyltransferase family 39 protein [Anaerolineae bacterium]